MVIYEYSFVYGDKGKETMFDVDPELKYVSGWRCTKERAIEAKSTSKPLKKEKEGEISVGDVVFVFRGEKGLNCEITALSPIESNIANKIKNCNTMTELDTLRTEIVSDKENFVENQKLFLSAKNRIKRNVS